MIVGFEELTNYEIVHGLFALIFVIISLIIGLKILLKGFSLNRKEFITVGLTWILLASPWWSASLSFIFIIFFSYAIEPLLYMILANVFVPIALICWIYSFCTFTYPSLKRKLLLIYLIISDLSFSHKFLSIYFPYIFQKSKT